MIRIVCHMTYSKASEMLPQALLELAKNALYFCLIGILMAVTVNLL